MRSPCFESGVSNAVHFFAGTTILGKALEDTLPELKKKLKQVPTQSRNQQRYAVMLRVYIE